MQHRNRQMITASLLAASLGLATVAQAGPALLQVHKPSGHPVYVAPHAIVSVEPARFMTFIGVTAELPPGFEPFVDPPQACLTLTLLEACGGDSGRSVNAVICVTESVEDIAQLMAADSPAPVPY